MTTNNLVRYYKAFSLDTLLQLYKDYRAEIQSETASTKHIANYTKRLEAVQAILNETRAGFKGSK